MGDLGLSETATSEEALVAQELHIAMIHEILDPGRPA